MKSATVRHLVPLLTALAACALALATAAHAGEDAAAWVPLPAHELAARRAGLRIGGLDVSVEVWIRDRIDGRELPPLGGLDLALVRPDGSSVLLPLVNRADGVQLERDAQIRVRIEGFTRVFGTPALRSARARLRAAFE